MDIDGRYPPDCGRRSCRAGGYDIGALDELAPAGRGATHRSFLWGRMRIPDIWTWLGGADNITATVVALFVLRGVFASIWKRTGGRRQLIRSAIYRIGIGVNEEYLRNLLGPPVYTQTGQYGVRLVWVNPYAHISILFESGAATGYTVTVVDKTFRLDLSKFSFGHFRGHLGAVTYQGAVSRDHEPWRAILLVGARRFSYFETHYFGNPGGYLYYVLAWSDSSDVGRFELPQNGAADEIGGGGQNDAANDHVHRYGRPNTVGVYKNDVSATPAALDLDTFRLLPVNVSVWLRVERRFIRFFRPF